MRRSRTGLIAVAALLASAGIGNTSAPARAQDLPMKVKGGHELGETAEQFFAEGHEKDLFSECASGDFKALNKQTKRLAKAYCAELTDTREKATSGKRTEYKIAGDTTELKKETFTFDGGHLVRVAVAYVTPNPESNNKGRSFEEIFDGVKDTYGPPTSESTQTIQSAYSLQQILHRAAWIAPHVAVLVVEQAPPEASIVVTACTRTEYDRMGTEGKPKIGNPIE